MTDGRQYELIRQPFTEQEMAAMHELLVERLGDVEKLEARKKQEAATLSAAIKGAAKEAHDLRAKLAMRCEMVEVEVVAMMDEPEPGMKSILRAGTDIVLRTEPMTSREKQQSFGFEESGGGPST